MSPAVITRQYLAIVLATTLLGLLATWPLTGLEDRAGKGGYDGTASMSGFTTRSAAVGARFVSGFDLPDILRNLFNSGERGSNFQSGNSDSHDDDDDDEDNGNDNDEGSGNSRTGRYKQTSSRPKSDHENHYTSADAGSSEPSGNRDFTGYGKYALSMSKAFKCRNYICPDSGKCVTNPASCPCLQRNHVRCPIKATDAPGNAGAKVTVSDDWYYCVPTASVVHKGKEDARIESLKQQGSGNDAALICEQYSRYLEL